MMTARLILAGAFGGCFGYAIMQFFLGKINIGLGVLAIGLFIAIFYIVSWIIDIRQPFQRE